ncbi:MAG: DUF433 domain-containing protein [Stigonema ocellatum SAG 48.90 = DSM 106950]|nr:DUF433 domain-containing protein [Stigonema ocellatum SAG 48.90 = DSM 106950]
MALASDGHSIIIHTERGLTIAGTRITIYDVMDHLAAGWTPKLILNWLPLTEEQLNAALSYIDANRTEVEAEYQTVLQATQQMREYWEDKNLKKAEGRGQKAEGIPINKFRGFTKDVVFLALRVSKYIFSLFFINEFRGFKPCGRGQIKNFSSLLPSAFCPLPFFGERLAQIAKMPPKPGQEEIYAKLQAWKAKLGITA